MAAKKEDQLDSLVSNPAESLAVELKTWFDLRTSDGLAKLVRSVFAIANRNGGFLLIGFDNQTGTPDEYTLDSPVHDVFHADAVQSALMKYASSPLAVETHFRERGEQHHPVIVIPPGVRTPTIVKSELKGDGGKRLLSVGDLFFRTLRANNTPSSAKILPTDYGDLMEICFNNREADFGGFLRRQLGQSDLAAVAQVVQALASGSTAPTQNPNLRERAEKALKSGQKLFASALMERDDDIPASVVQGLSMEVALVVDPERSSELANRSFLDKLSAANPNYTGWPVWWDSRSAHQEKNRPVVKGNAWQALIVILDGWPPHLDFMRLDPRGHFYLWRAMQDDLSDKVDPGSSLDVFLMILRVAEVLAVGVSFAKALGWEDDAISGFAFRWSALRDRKLGSWANPLRVVGSGVGRSSESSANAFAAVPVGTPHAALAPYVGEVVNSLFALFDGYEVKQPVVEDAVKRLIERRL